MSAYIYKFLQILQVKLTEIIQLSDQHLINLKWNPGSLITFKGEEKYSGCVSPYTSFSVCSHTHTHTRCEHRVCDLGRTTDFLFVFYCLCECSSLRVCVCVFYEWLLGRDEIKRLTETQEISNQLFRWAAEYTKGRSSAKFTENTFDSVLHKYEFVFVTFFSSQKRKI